jgi:hypothetical protein
MKRETIILYVLFNLAWIFAGANTKWFTYLFGDLNPYIEIWAWAIIVIGNILFWSVFLAKKWSAKAKLEPFREM